MASDRRATLRRRQRLLSIFPLDLLAAALLWGALWALLILAWALGA
jgi:hypothetical protein